MPEKEVIHNIIVILHNNNLINTKMKHKLIAELNSNMCVNSIKDIFKGGVGGGVLMKDECGEEEDDEAGGDVSKSICGVG